MKKIILPDPPDLLTPAEVGRLLWADPKTVTRWAKTGRLRAVRLPSGHRRYRKTDIDALLNGQDGSPR